jgi:hypothetical protein
MTILPKIGFRAFGASTAKFKKKRHINMKKLELLIFKKQKVVGFCLFSVLRKHKVIFFLIRKQLAKWS